MSLNKGPLTKFVFTGLDNYIRALTTSTFWGSTLTTFVYAALTMPITMTLGLFFAYLLFHSVRGRTLYRTVFFLPT